MRCRACNIDLGDNYTKCPLCSSDSFPDLPLLDDISNAPYPEYKTSAEIEPRKYHADFPQKYVFRITAIISILLSAISFTGVAVLRAFIAPAIMAATALFFFVSGIAEKGKLLHSAVALLASVFLLAVLFIIALATGNGVYFTSITLCVGLGVFLLLCVIKPKNMRNQLRALFNI